MKFTPCQAAALEDDVFLAAAETNDRLARTGLAASTGLRTTLSGTGWSIWPVNHGHPADFSGRGTCWANAGFLSAVAR